MLLELLVFGESIVDGAAMDFEVVVVIGLTGEFLPAVKDDDDGGGDDGDA